MNNKKCLTILFNIICMMENMGYIYLNQNYEKICYDYKMIDGIISNYLYILTKNGKYALFFKNRNKYIFVIFFESFSNNNKIDINYTYKRFKEYIVNNKYWTKMENIIIICPDEYENQICKKINSEELIDLCTTIKYSNVLYNPTKHETFNKHEKIKNFDQKYKKYNLKIPIILKKDIACLWYGFNINDIIKINRKNDTLCYKIVK
jgi:DNA-directed RNA polymerase subunit H (RpoH/RPB5)